jgi:DNA-binding HxlR family transcriptional regulator
MVDTMRVRGSTLNRLIALSHRRWNVPILATLHAEHGAKFVTLCHRVAEPGEAESTASQGGVRESLDLLIHLGWVERLGGYGHPLRPEYVLTDRGRRIAPGAAKIDEVLRGMRLREPMLRRWPLPILYVVGTTPSRFTEIVGTIRSATDRAVSLTLKQMMECSTIERVSSEEGKDALHVPATRLVYRARQEAMPLVAALANAV